MPMYTALLLLIRFLLPLAVGAIALLVLWRIMKAQEEIARHLDAIERKMGGGA